MELIINGLDHLVLNVTDVEVAAAWYQRVLGMQREDFTPAGSSNKPSAKALPGSSSA